MASVGLVRLGVGCTGPLLEEAMVWWVYVDSVSDGGASVVVVVDVAKVSSWLSSSSSLMPARNGLGGGGADEFHSDSRMFAR